MSSTARRGIDAQTLVAYLDTYSRYVTGGNPRRSRLSINGYAPDQDTDVRIIRRWRTQSSVTVPAAERMLAKCGLSLASYIGWAQVHHRTAVLRGVIEQENA